MTRFLQAISHYSPAEDSFKPIPDVEEDLAATLNDADRAFLHQFLVDHSERLGVELLRGKHAGLRYWQEGVLSSSTTGQATWAQVTDLIAALGTPPETAARSAAQQWDASPEQAYATFMASHEARGLSDDVAWKDTFFEISGNKASLDCGRDTIRS